MENNFSRLDNWVISAGWSFLLGRSVLASGQHFTADCTTGVTTRLSHSSTKTSAEGLLRLAVTHLQHSGSLWSGRLWPSRESVRVRHRGQSWPQRLDRATRVTVGSRLDTQGRVCLGESETECVPYIIVTPSHKSRGKTSNLTCLDFTGVYRKVSFLNHSILK